MTTSTPIAPAASTPEAVALCERQRVARELHDGVAQLVVALGYQAEELADQLGGGPGRDAVARLREEISQVALELRRAIYDLREEPERDGGLSAELSAFLDDIRGSNELRLHLDLDERGPRLARAIEVEVLRIAQEAIANVRQHARAINLWVRLARDGERLRLVVEDDGVGTVAPRPGHFGLRGMRERAEQIGGVLEIGVRRDGGSVVTLWAGGTTRTGTSPTYGRRES